MLEKSIPMPKQNIKERINNFDEVALGYNEEEAIAEAERCLQCPKPSCVADCPVEIDIPSFIKALKERDFDKASEIVKEKNSLPAVCGRVCPQEEQCQERCVLGKRFEPVSIGRLERFIADYERRKGLKIPKIPPSTGKKIAIVGSGPAGLTAAADLAKKGHKVIIFEALHKPGGVLMYGIPEFRMPKNVVEAEIKFVERLGATIETDTVIGNLYTIHELFETGFDAVFLGTGAGLPRFLKIVGENLVGIYSANEFLIRVNLMKGYKFPEYDTPIKIGRKVAVIGAGNVAMDAARSALRLGAEDVHIIYRRSRVEAPARLEELENAEEEGIKFRFLTNPIRYYGDKRVGVKGMECVRMQLGEPDDSGRRRPIPINDSNFNIEVDTVIVAIGQSPNPLIPSTTEGLKTTKRGTIIVEEETGKTSLERVYAGGDIVSGAATVISAMGAGKRAAKDIHKHIT